MDDTMSVETTANDVLNQKNIFEMEWSEEHEHILVDWADKAMCYRWLHAQANMKYAVLTRWYTIPVIIISTLTGTANFAQDRVPESYIPIFVMMVGAMNLIAGIISTIAQFLKINELNESHRVSSIAWDKFYRNIKIELAKNPRERIPVGQMIKLSKEEFDRLMETSPVIQPDIILKFNTTFNGNKSFDDIKKPEICDDLVSTDTYRYVAKEISKEKTSRLKKVVHKAREMVKNMKRIKEFATKFQEAQGRLPTRDEIIETMRDKYKEFQIMMTADIERIADRFLEENIQDIEVELSNMTEPKNITINVDNNE